METLQMFEVGGCVRDEFMGIPTKDVDFSVLAPSFAAMVAGLEAEGFEIFTTTEDKLTARAKVPTGHKLRTRTNVADFVLARQESSESDGRRPVSVEAAGSIFPDLARRDFTVNAMARDENGVLIDPFGGEQDIKTRTLRFVGDPEARIFEDGVRVLRGFRFMVTHGLTPEPRTLAALNSDLAVEMLLLTKIERIHEEVHKMFSRATVSAMRTLVRVGRDEITDAIFRDDLRLDATRQKVRGQKP